MPSSADIVNQALALVGDNTPPVTGNAPAFDNSAAGIAAAELYTPCVQTVARRFGYDFSRFTANLQLSGNPAVSPFLFEYLYPGDGIQVRQLMPAAGSIDPNNPLPVNWDVANTIIAATGAQAKVIRCNVANAVAVYTNQPNENTWDPGFREAVVRLLASELAQALFGRPDTARDSLQSGAGFEAMAQQTRD